MLTTFVTICLLGFVVGLWLRGGALFLVSCLVLVYAAVSGITQNWNLLATIGYGWLFLICLQASFLAGLAVSSYLRIRKRALPSLSLRRTKNESAPQSVFDYRGK